MERVEFFFYRLVGLKEKKIEILWIREIPNSNLSKRKKRKIIVGVKVKWKTFFKIIKGRYSSFVYFERDCFYIVFIKTFHYSFLFPFFTLSKETILNWMNQMNNFLLRKNISQSEIIKITRIE